MKSARKEPMPKMWPDPTREGPKTYREASGREDSDGYPAWAQYRSHNVAFTRQRGWSGATGG